MLPACSESWPRSSAPAFGANSMPSPAPSTVPVRSPITKLPPPLPSLLSKRSYPSAMSPPSVCGFVRFVPRLQHPFDRDAQAADDADHPAGLGPHVRAHAIRRVVDPIDRVVNRLIDAFGLFLHLRGHVLDILENRVHARHRRRHL